MKQFIYMGAQMPQTRDSVLDIMKGIAMMFVIMAHTNFPWESYHTFANLRSVLFFVISGYFAKDWLMLDYLRLGVKRIFFPIVFTSVLMLLFVFVLDEIFDTKAFYVALKSVLLGTSSYPSVPCEMYIISDGPLWFLWATIFVRFFWILLKNLISNEIVRGGLIFTMAIAISYTKQFYTMPFSIQAAFGALGFFYAGYLCRKYDFLNSDVGKRIFPFFAICLVYCVGCSNIDINLCVYDAFYVIDLLGAVAAFYCVYAVVKKYNTDSKFWNALNYLGRNSLIALCIHAIDQNILVYWFPVKIWSYFDGNFQMVCVYLIRVLWVFLGIYFILKFRLIREKIFFIK